jgi:hypothetical protein
MEMDAAAVDAETALCARNEALPQGPHEHTDSCKDLDATKHTILAELDERLMLLHALKDAFWHEYTTVRAREVQLDEAIDQYVKAIQYVIIGK